MNHNFIDLGSGALCMIYLYAWGALSEQGIHKIKDRTSWNPGDEGM